MATDWIDEGWELRADLPGIGRVYSARPHPVEANSDEDAPEVDNMNDEGEEDPTDVPDEIWVAVAASGRTVFTRSGLPYARGILTDMTGNQYSMF